MNGDERSSESFDIMSAKIFVAGSRSFSTAFGVLSSPYHLSDRASINQFNEYGVQEARYILRPHSYLRLVRSISLEREKYRFKNELWNYLEYAAQAHSHLREGHYRGWREQESPFFRFPMFGAPFLPPIDFLTVAERVRSLSIEEGENLRLGTLLLFPFVAQHKPIHSSPGALFEQAIATDAATLTPLVSDFPKRLAMSTEALVTVADRAGLLLFLYAASQCLAVLDKKAPGLDRDLGGHEISLPGSPRLENITLKELLSFAGKHTERIWWLPMAAGSAAAAQQLLQGDYASAILMSAGGGTSAIILGSAATLVEMIRRRAAHFESRSVSETIAAEALQNGIDRQPKKPKRS